MKSKITKLAYSSIISSSFLIWLYNLNYNPDFLSGIGLDKILHFAVGFGLNGLLRLSDNQKLSKFSVYYIGLLSFLWEVFEYTAPHFGFTITDDLSMYESLKDMSSTIFGSISNNFIENQRYKQIYNKTKQTFSKYLRKYI